MNKQFSGPFDVSKMMTGRSPTEFLKKYTSALSAFNVPGAELNALVESQAKNVEALCAASALAWGGLQAVLVREQEIVREMTEDASAAVAAFSTASSPTEMVTKQAEWLNKAFVKRCATLRELAEMSVSSNTEAFKVLKNRNLEIMGEMKQFMTELTSRGAGAQQGAKGMARPAPRFVLGSC